MKRHAGFIIFFSVAILVIFRDVLFLRSAFLEGDYADQFYPWSLIYAESIKAWSLPLWTQFFHSGFPLAAEGQTGVFYPLNMFFFAVFSFKFAYNYIVVLHFVLAGIFTYIFSRRLGADQWGGALAAFLVCFGSAYAGCFYNTVTVKTLIWVPLVLYLLEKYFDDRKARYLIYCGIIAGIQLLAGFAQLAIYSLFFYGVYFMSGLIARKDIKPRDIVLFVSGCSLAALIFLPQLFISLPLAKASMREGATLGFALWGSFSPLNFMTLVFPSWISQGMTFYIGVLGLFFLTAGIVMCSRNKRSMPVVMVMVLGIFLALGKYNPLYVLVLKLTGFYSFRNPSKFLFFGIFAASVISGLGMSGFFRQAEEAFRQKVSRIFLFVIGSLLGLFLSAKAVLILFGDKILHAGEWYAANFVHGSEFHRYSLDLYMAKVKGIYYSMLRGSAFTSPHIVMALVMSAMAIALGVYFLRKRSCGRYLRPLAFALIVIDIYIFSFYGTGFRGNWRPFSVLAPEKASLFFILERDRSMFRILPFGLASGKLPNWARPNLNSVYGIESAGAYSPLVARDYYEALRGLECVDNSLGLMEPQEEALKRRWDMLLALNVKYVVSDRKLGIALLKEAGMEDGVYLYEVIGAMPRVFPEAPDGTGAIGPVKYSSGNVGFKTSFRKTGYVVLSEYFYPGWAAFIDGQRVGIERYKGILMKIAVPEGEHEVEFRFSPFNRPPGKGLS